MITPLATREVTTATTIMRRTETRVLATMTLLAEKDAGVAEMTAITTTADVGTAVTPLGTAGMIDPAVYRTSEVMTPNILMLKRSSVPYEETMCPLPGAPRKISHCT